MSENSTSQNEGIYHSKNNKVFLIGSSHLSRINNENFRVELKEIGFILNVSLELIQTDYHSIPMLVDDIYRIQRHHKIELSHYQRRWVIEGIINIGLKFKYYGVCQISISLILARSSNDFRKGYKRGREVYVRLTVLLSCIRKILIGIVYGEMVLVSQMKVGLFCTKNFLEHLNSFFHQNINFSVHFVSKAWLDWQPNKTK